MEVNIKIIETTDEKAAVLAIRRTVFIEEQNIPEHISNPESGMVFLVHDP